MQPVHIREMFETGRYVLIIRGQYCNSTIVLACTHYERVIVFLQHLLEELASQNAVKDELVPLLDVLAEGLPAGDAELETLRVKLEALKKSLLSISDILRQRHSNLETALPLAKAFEEAECRLCPWVGNTRERLEGLGTLPAEAQQVQKLKSELEVDCVEIGDGGGVGHLCVKGVYIVWCGTV